MNNTSLTIDPLANDSDRDDTNVSQTLSINSYTIPAHGTLTPSGNSFSYTPVSDFVGSDSFLYSIVDQDGAVSNTGSVTILVTSPNTPPTLSSSGFSTLEDNGLASKIIASDVDGNTLSYSTSTLPTHGTLFLQSDGNFTYTPASNFFGTDTFSISVSDGQSVTGPIPMNIYVTAVNDPPIAVDDDYSFGQDTPFFIPVLSNDSDVDSSNLALTGIIQPSNGTLSISGTGFLYTPNTGFTGSDMFTYQVIDDL